MKYVIAIIFGIFSFFLTLKLNNCVKNIDWLYSTGWIYIIASWNAIINFRASLWVYYDIEHKSEVQNKPNQIKVHFDKIFQVIEQIRQFIFNFVGMLIGWVSLFLLIYRINNSFEKLGFIDLGLTLFILLGISGNLPWISTKSNLGH